MYAPRHDPEHSSQPPDPRYSRATDSPVLAALGALAVLGWVALNPLVALALAAVAAAMAALVVLPLATVRVVVALDAFARDGTVPAPVARTRSYVARVLAARSGADA